MPREEAAGWSGRGTAWAGASRSDEISVPVTPQTKSWTRVNAHCPWLLSAVRGHGRRDGEKGPAITRGGGEACMRSIRCQGSLAAEMGLYPSLGCLCLRRSVLLQDLITLVPFCIPTLLPPPFSHCFYFPLYLILA